MELLWEDCLCSGLQLARKAIEELGACILLLLVFVLLLLLLLFSALLVIGRFELHSCG